MENKMAYGALRGFALLASTLLAPQLLLADGVADNVAADATNKAYRLMAESEQRDEGWVDNRSEMQMIIRRGDGREIVRELRTQALEGASGEDKSLMVFDEPLDVRGTVFLTHSYPLNPDDQWIYLPSQNKVKRISSKRRNGRFMGSEFTFEDMAAFALEENDYIYLRQEACDELQCHVIEVRPKDKYSGYEKFIYYMDVEELRAWRIEFYDKRTGKHVKTMTMSNYQRYLDKFWRAEQATMRNMVSGAETEIRWRKEAFRTGMSEQDFSKTALERRQ
ncbi:MAG: hypothetical protein ACI9OO_001234 [Bacteroidia bacterium]